MNIQKLRENMRIIGMEEFAEEYDLYNPDYWDDFGANSNFKNKNMRVFHCEQNPKCFMIFVNLTEHCEIRADYFNENGSISTCGHLTELSELKDLDLGSLNKLLKILNNNCFINFLGEGFMITDDKNRGEKNFELAEYDEALEYAKEMKESLSKNKAKNLNKLKQKDFFQKALKDILKFTNDNIILSWNIECDSKFMDKYDDIIEDQYESVTDFIEDCLKNNNLNYFVGCGFEDMFWTDSSGDYCIFPWHDSKGKNQNSMIVNKPDKNLFVKLDSEKLFEIKLNNIDNYALETLAGRVEYFYYNEKDNKVIVEDWEGGYYDISKYPNPSNYDYCILDQIHQ